MLNANGVLICSVISSKDKYFDDAEVKVSPYGIPLYTHSERMFDSNDELAQINLRSISKGDLVHTLDKRHGHKMTVPDRLLSYCFLQKNKTENIKNLFEFHVQ